MTWIAVAVGGAALVGGVAGGVIQGNAVKDASNSSAQAAANSLGVQQQEFNQTTANNKPFLDTGTSALNQLAGLYGVNSGGSGTPGGIDPNSTFYQSPDYQFQLSQGIKGVDAGAAARGELDSGATRKAEMSYAGNLASGQFNNYAQRLQSLAGIGQASANNQATAGANYAGSVTGINTANANNQGNLALGQGNSTASSINGVVGQLTNLAARNPFGSSYTPNSTAGAQTFAPGATAFPQQLGPATDDGSGVIY